jgi:hypothetical protein
MTTLDDLKKQISAAQARKARAEILRDQAQTDLDTARAQLKEEFGISTPAEAKELIGSLTQQRDDAISAAQDQLEAAG